MSWGTKQLCVFIRMKMSPNRLVVLNMSSSHLIGNLFFDAHLSQAVPVSPVTQKTGDPPPYPAQHSPSGAMGTMHCDVCIKIDY